MSSTMKWSLGIVVLAVLAWIGVSMANKTPTETGPIKIGFIGPLSGDAAAYGEPISNGLRLAEKEINDAGGIDGRLVQVIYEDAQCDGAKAASAAQKLISIDGVKFIVGGVCSSEVFGYAPITNAAKVLTVTPGGSAAGISDLGDYVFRNATNDGEKGVVAVDYLAKSHKKVGLITEKTDSTNSTKESFIQRAEGIDLEISADEEVVEGTRDFRTALSKIKASGAEALYINVQTPASVVRVAQQARDLGMTVPFMTADFNSPDVASGGSAVEGLVVVVAPGLADEGKGKKLTDAYMRMFGEEPPFAFYVGAAYDAVQLFAQGIERYGENTDKVKNYLYDVEYNGTLGNYSFDENGDITGVTFVLQQLKNGTFVNL